jgi:hypothetical protein
MWKSSIIHNLAWQQEKERFTKKKVRPPSSPSWSWLSQFQPVFTCHIERFQDPLAPELLSWSIQLADESSPFGHVLGGELELMATVTHSPSIHRTAIEAINFSIDCDGRGVSEIPSRHIRGTDEFVSESYYYVYLGNTDHKGDRSSFGLLLQSVGNGTFIRKGLLKIHSECTGALIWASEHAQRMKIRLVWDSDRTFIPMVPTQLSASLLYYTFWE